ncbi:MAG TPA: rod shape-determining protein MreD [bacterium]|nr:rod shape-determining protein MreD [bacterium]
MRRTFLWIFVVTALVLQVTLFTKIEISGARPDAVIVVLVYLAFSFGAIVGSIVGFLIGLAEFAIMSTTMASLPLAGTVVGFLVGRYGTKIMYENYLVQLAIIFASVLVFDSINLVWSAPSDLATDLVRWSIPGAAYTAVVGVGLVAFFERILGLRLVL